MALDAILERFIHDSPVSVIARLALHRAIAPEWMDSLFEPHRERQYTRELLFSTVGHRSRHPAVLPVHPSGP